MFEKHIFLAFLLKILSNIPLIIWFTSIHKIITNSIYFLFLKCLQPYVVHVKDVGTNGNCGCWAIACTLGMGSMIGHRLGKTCFGSYIAIFNGIWGLRQTNEK